MMSKPNIPYGRQSIDSSDIAEVVGVLKSDFITQGPKVEQFEKLVASYVGAKYAVCVNSGTSALVSTCFAAGIGRGDEVITTPYTFCATSNSFLWFGAKPVFVDIDEDTLNIDASKIEKAISPKTKAIVSVDFAGLPCEYDRILEVAKKHKLVVIDDAAHALGSKFDGKTVGSITDLTCFSFHPVKTITTGEGGMITTNNDAYYKKLLLFRNHGISKKREDLGKYDGDWYYEMLNLGLNLRLPDIGAALGISQLKRIDGFIARRRKIVETYNRGFSDLPVTTPGDSEKTFSAWHLYPVRLNLNKLKTGRREIFDALREKGLGVQVHYIPVHLQPYYMRNFGYKRGDYPIAEKVYESEISLPLFPAMTDLEVDRVIGVVSNVINRFRK